jgi:hypothetical protein
VFESESEFDSDSVSEFDDDVDRLLECGLASSNDDNADIV